MDPSDLERKLLEILDEKELDPPAEVSGSVEEAFPYLDDKAKKIMAKFMTAELPSPEEIEQAEKLAQHNAAISRKRDDNLRRRKLRRNNRKRK